MHVNGMKRSLVYEKSSGKSSPDIFMRSISCGYDLVLCACIMPMFMLSTGHGEGYINGMKAV